MSHGPGNCSICGAPLEIDGNRLRCSALFDSTNPGFSHAVRKHLPLQGPLMTTAKADLSGVKSLLSEATKSSTNHQVAEIERLKEALLHISELGSHPVDAAMIKVIAVNALNWMG